MKKLLFSILFIAGIVAGAVTGKAEVMAVSAVGFTLSIASVKRSEFAYITLVPAVITDAAGNPIPPVTRAQKAIYDFLSMKSNQITNRALQFGDLVYDPITYYIRYNITGLSGRQKILSTSTQKVVGITNFDKGLLPQYYNFAFDKIAVRYAVATSADASPSVGAYSSVRSSMDAGLANGELIVSVNKQIIVETPVIDFTSNAAITGGSTRDMDGGELQVPKIFPENLGLEVELNLAGTIPSAANNTYLVEVAFMGVQARLR